MAQCGYILEPRKIEIHARLLEDNPDVDVAYGSVRYFRDFRKDERLLSAGGRRSHSWVPELNGSGPEILDRLLQRNILPVHSALVRRTVYGDTPPFDERVRSGKDYLSWILLAAAGARFSYFDEEGARALIRVHGHNMSRDRLLRIRAMACAARLYEKERFVGRHHHFSPQHWQQRVQSMVPGFPRAGDFSEQPGKQIPLL